ncbi:MAG: hypothetical protein AAF590_03605 [Pseudomonadota bacterium]
MPKAKPAIFDKLSPEERYAKAQSKLQLLSDRVQEATSACAMVEQFAYSKDVVSRIPRSPHARGYSVLKSMLFQHGTLKVAALMDKPSIDRVSLPTVELLLNTPEVLKLVFTQVRSWREDGGEIMDNPETEPETYAYVKAWVEEQGRVEADKDEAGARKEMPKLLADAAELSTCDELKAVRHARDHYIAHNLTAPGADQPPEPKMRYGHETTLLKRISPVVQGLLLFSTGHNSNLSREHASTAQHLAKKFWSNVEFKGPDS